MRLLADENVPRPSVRRLREGDHDVLWVGELAPGILDTAVLAWAVREARVLLTFDRDYGDLIFRADAPVPPAVIYCRFTPANVRVAGDLLLVLLDRGGAELTGNFVVFDGSKVRARRLPT